MMFRFYNAEDNPQWQRWQAARLDDRQPICPVCWFGLQNPNDPDDEEGEWGICGVDTTTDWICMDGHRAWPMNAVLAWCIVRPDGDLEWVDFPDLGSVVGEPTVYGSLEVPAERVVTFGTPMAEEAKAPAGTGASEKDDDLWGVEEDGTQDGATGSGWCRTTTSSSRRSQPQDGLTGEGGHRGT